MRIFVSKQSNFSWLLSISFLRIESLCFDVQEDIYFRGGVCRERCWAHPPRFKNCQHCHVIRLHQKIERTCMYDHEKREGVFEEYKTNWTRQSLLVVSSFLLLRFPQEPGRYTFIGKMVFQRKSNASPINLWNKILGQFKLRVFTTENIYSTRVIYDLWTCGCIDEYKRELRQHLKLGRKFASFPPV